MTAKQRVTPGEVLPRNIRPKCAIHAIMLSCYHATKPSCYHAILPPCHHAKTLPCHHATMLPCHHAIMLPCHHATMLPCHRAIILPCYHAIILSCYHATVDCCTKIHGFSRIMTRPAGQVRSFLHKNNHIYVYLLQRSYPCHDRNTSSFPPRRTSLLRASKRRKINLKSSVLPNLTPCRESNTSLIPLRRTSLF